jgi:predicted amidohydrolase YtcJ
VIPGLIDSHMHAIRAAQSFSTEVHWFGTTSIEEALGRLRAAASPAPGSSSPAAGPRSSSANAAGRRRRSSSPPRRTIRCTCSGCTAGRCSRRSPTRR